MVRSQVAAAMVAGVVGVLGAGAADARVSVKSTVVHYRISGGTGDALLDAMDRRGPKQGLLTRAIAQTSYTISWSIDWQEKAGRCRVASVTADLAIKYNYPEVSGTMRPELERRWNRFMAGVRAHEETHGRIARQMVRAAEKSVSGVASPDDRSCRKAQAEVKRRVAAVYAEYEARQQAFDRVEHAGGGHVERLVARLAGG